MAENGTIWQRLFMRVGLLVLALNIMLVSIPRCDMIFAVLQHQNSMDVPADGESCHGPAQHQGATSKALTSLRLCECSVFQFMAIHVSKLNINEHVAFRVQTERLLTFPWNAFLSDFKPKIEPPYPKV